MATEAERISSFHLPLGGRKGASAAKSRIPWPHIVTQSNNLSNRIAPIPSTLARLGFAHTPSTAEPDRVTHHLCTEITFSGWDVDTDDVMARFELATQGNGPLQAVARIYKSNAVREKYVWTDEAYLPDGSDMLKARKDTFGKKWPYDGKKGWKPTSKNIAEAGFHYTPTREEKDMVTCVYCEKSLGGWEKQDDPREEHQRRHPDCPFFNAVLESLPRASEAVQEDSDEEVEEEQPDPPPTRRGGRAASKQPSSDIGTRVRAPSVSISTTARSRVASGGRKRGAAKDDASEDSAHEEALASIPTRQGRRAPAAKEKAEVMATTADAAPTMRPTRSVSRTKVLSTVDEPTSTQLLEASRHARKASESKARAGRYETAPSHEEPSPESDDKQKVEQIPDATMIEHNDVASEQEVAALESDKTADESDPPPLPSSKPTEKSTTSKRRRKQELAAALSDPAASLTRRGKPVAKKQMEGQAEEGEDEATGGISGQEAAPPKRRPGRPRKIKAPAPALTEDAAHGSDKPSQSSAENDAPPPSPPSPPLKRATKATVKAKGRPKKAVMAPAEEDVLMVQDNEDVQNSRAEESVDTTIANKAIKKTRAPKASKRIREVSASVDRDADNDSEAIPRRRGRPAKKAAGPAPVPLPTRERDTRIKEARAESEPSDSEEVEEEARMSVDESFDAPPVASTSVIRPAKARTGKQQNDRTASVPVVVLDSSISRSRSRISLKRRTEEEEQESEEEEATTSEEDEEVEAQLSVAEPDIEMRDAEGEHLRTSTPPPLPSIVLSPVRTPLSRPSSDPTNLPATAAIPSPDLAPLKDLVDLELTPMDRERSLRQFLQGEMEHALGLVRERGERSIAEVEERMMEGRREAERRLRGLAV